MSFSFFYCCTCNDNLRSAFFASPRRLCAAFDARKRPPSNKTDYFQRKNPPLAEDGTHNSPRDSFAPRGSMTLRRAKAASQQQCRTIPKEKTACSRAWDVQLRKDKPQPPLHATESSTAKQKGTQKKRPSGLFSILTGSSGSWRPRRPGSRGRSTRQSARRRWSPSGSPDRYRGGCRSACGG